MIRTARELPIEGVTSQVSIAMNLALIKMFSTLVLAQFS